MIRIFAPSTRDPVLNRDGASGLLLLVHFAAFVVMVFPPGKSPSREMLLERLVVFLVPPDDPGPTQASAGAAGWSSESSGAEDGIATTEPPDESVLSHRREVPALDSMALNVSTVAELEDDALTVLEVDSAVVRDPTSAAPEYPAHLLRSGVEGRAEVRYVIDTLGSVDTLSYRVLRTSHPDFAVSVRRALPHMRFRPAISSGRRVRQLIEQTFSFRINPSRGTPGTP